MKIQRQRQSQMEMRDTKAADTNRNEDVKTPAEIKGDAVKVSSLPNESHGSMPVTATLQVPHKTSTNVISSRH
jgi:hypothetical protein